MWRGTKYDHGIKPLIGVTIGVSTHPDGVIELSAGIIPSFLVVFLH